jgi:dynein heavy chain
MKNPSTVNTINNPYPDWINNWDMICELERQLPNFANIVSSFIHNSKDWKRWYSEDNPEDISLPLEWETKCDRLRKMIIIKTIRPDRVLAAVNKFVIEKIGESFVGSPQFNMESIYQDSNKTTSVIFILAPGVDPRKNLENLAKQYGRELINVSLGKG